MGGGSRVSFATAIHSFVLLCECPYALKKSPVNTATSLTHLRTTARNSVTAKEKANHVSMIGLYLCRRLPTLPHTFACSTIGPAGLNFRVRDGNGWIPRGMITDVLSSGCC